MRHRKLVTVVAFAAATAVGCIVVRKLRQRGKPASDDKQEPKRRAAKHLEGPTTGTGDRSTSLCSHSLSDLHESEEQDSDDGQLLPSSPGKLEFHTSRQPSQLQRPPVPAAVDHIDSTVEKTQLALASQAGEGQQSLVSPAAIATEPQTLEVPTDNAVVNGDKAVQGEAKPPAAATTSATGLIAAFRPVEQLSASSAATCSPASTAGSNASDRQAAGDLQEIEFRSHLHALLLRANVPQLEWTAHTSEDAHEEGNAVCPFSLDGEVTAGEEASVPHAVVPVNMASPLPSWPDLTACSFSLEGEITDEEAFAPPDAGPVNMASPLPSWPDLTGDARVHNPERASQLQRQHSPDSSTAAPAVATATTPAEGGMSSTHISAHSSPTTVALIQPEQAVGEAQSVKPTDRAASADGIGSRVQNVAAGQPSGSSSASAHAVVPQVQGRAVVLSSAASDSNQMCLVEDDRQSMTDSQAQTSAEEVASRVQDATADVSAQLPGRVTVAHAALATPPAVNAESAPADAASAEAAAAAQMALDAEVARHLQDEEDSKTAGFDSGLQSVESMAALQAKTDALQADTEKLLRGSKLRPVGTSNQASSQPSWEELDQLQLELVMANSLSQYAYVGEKAPLEPRAGADKDSPHGRLPFFFSRVRSIKGDGNCFYRAVSAGMLEGLCRDSRPACIAALSEAFMSQHSAVDSCLAIDDETKAVALQGHNFLQDMLEGISRHGSTWDDMLVFLNQPDLDRAMVQFLRAITARELWANQPEYDCRLVGIDKYRGMSFARIVQHETLRMKAYAEELQVSALKAVLPVRLKLLGVAGDQPYVRTCEPGLPVSPSRPTTAAETQAQTASAAGGAAMAPQQVWLMHRPMHYELVYPAEGYGNVHGAMKTWQQA